MKPTRSVIPDLSLGISERKGITVINQNKYAGNSNSKNTELRWGNVSSVKTKYTNFCNNETMKTMKTHKNDRKMQEILEHLLK